MLSPYEHRGVDVLGLDETQLARRPGQLDLHGVVGLEHGGHHVVRRRIGISGDDECAANDDDRCRHRRRR